MRALYVVLGGAVALLVFSLTDKGKSTIMAAADSIGATVRGVRNNNPGNIRKGPAWQGLAPDQTDPAFARFVSMPYGIRALVTTLRTYQSRYNLRTVAEMINRWAPPSENDTGAYIRAAAQTVGVAQDAPIDMRDAETAFRMARAIIKHENGIAGAALVSDADVRAGVGMAA